MNCLAEPTGGRRFKALPLLGGGQASAADASTMHRLARVCRMDEGEGVSASAVDGGDIWAAKWRAGVDDDDDERLDPVHAEGPWARVYGGRINNAGQMPHFHAAADAWAEAAARWDEAAAWAKTAESHYKIEAAHLQEAVGALAVAGTEAVCALATAGAEDVADYIEARVPAAPLVEARAAMRLATRAREMAGDAHNKSSIRAKAASAAEGVAAECEMADGNWTGTVKEPRGKDANIARAKKAMEAATQAGERAQAADAAAGKAAEARSWYDPVAAGKAAEASSSWAEWANWSARLYAINTAMSVAFVQALTAAGDPRRVGTG